MRTIDQMVQSEVLCCMSGIVSTLAQGYGGAIKPHSMGEKELEALCEQAAELASSVPDYEEAAIQAGWLLEEATREGSGAWYAYKIVAGAKQIGSDQFESRAEAWRDVCDAQGIEPYDREVFEHWAVTDWFADKLIAAGEKVDKDFGSLCVWARTTTGQGISSDGVVKRIYAEAHK